MSKISETGFLSTTRGNFLNNLKLGLYHAETASIVTGFISVEGLEHILDELFRPDKVRILVGASDEKGLELQLILSGDKTSNKQFGSTDTYSALRYLVQIGKLEICFIKKNQGFRLFHAKGYYFKLRDNRTYFICGSNNLTASGLIYNREWAIETYDYSTCYYANENFELEWRLNKQDVQLIVPGTYLAKIIDSGVGVNKSNMPYIEVIYKLLDPYEPKNFFITVEQINSRKSGRNLNYMGLPNKELENLSDVSGIDTSVVYTLEDWCNQLPETYLLLDIENTGSKLKIKNRKKTEYRG